MGCTTSRPDEPSTQERHDRDSPWLPSIAESSLTDEEPINREEATTPSEAGVQTKANKACCGNYCRVLNCRDYCAHSNLNLASYCTLCRSRNWDRYMQQQGTQRAQARKLIEEAMEEDDDADDDAEIHDEASEPDQVECPICLDAATDPCELCCGHTVCLAHVEKLVECPLCRRPLNATKGGADERGMHLRRHPFSAHIILTPFGYTLEPHPLRDEWAAMRRSTSNEPHPFTTQYMYLVERARQLRRNRDPFQSPLLIMSDAE